MNCAAEKCKIVRDCSECTYDDDARRRAPSRFARLPISLWAIISGLLIALIAANVWPLLLLNLGVPLAALSEAIFLVLYLWWVGGGGPPTQRKQPARRRSAAAHSCPGNGFGALLPRYSLPRRFIPPLFYCFALCPFRKRRSGVVMIFLSSPPRA